MLAGTPGDGEVQVFERRMPYQKPHQLGTCQSNTTILITDGYWSGSSPGLRRDADGDSIKTLTGRGVSMFDGGAFKGAGSETNTLGRCCDAVLRK